MTPAEKALRDRFRRRSAAISPEIVSRQLAAYDLIRALLTESELARAISNGTLDAVLQRLLSDDSIDPVLDDIRRLLDGLVIDSGRRAFADLPKAYRDATRLRSSALFRSGMGTLNPRIIDAARRLDTRVIEGLKTEIRETVRQRAIAGIQAGENPRTTARAMREVLGLAPNQEAAIRNFERMLSAGDREALSRALRDKRFDATLRRALGKDGTGLTSSQIRTMVDAYRRRMVAFNAETHARSAALDVNRLAQRMSWENAADAGIVDRALLMRIRIGVNDSRERPEHVAINNEVVAFDEPYSNGEMVPGDNSYNCFVPDTLVQGSYVAGLCAEYLGEVLTIRTAGGRELTVTPNHPILTPRGFVAANALSEGDDLICHGGEVDADLLRPEACEYERPTRIADVFGALRERWPQARRYPRLVDLHGDAIGVKGYIDVVGPDVPLLADHGAEFPQDSSDGILVGPPTGQAFEVRAGRSDLLVERSHAPGCGLPCSPALTLDGGPVLLENLPLEPFRVGPAADLDASLYEVPSDGTSGNAVADSQDVLGRAGQVISSNFSAVKYDTPSVCGCPPRPGRVATSSSPEGDVVLVENPVENADASAGFAKDLLDRFSELVAVDQVIEIGHSFFTGYVYDLQSVGGWNIAGGIFVSNCRCIERMFVAQSVRLVS